MRHQPANIPNSITSRPVWLDNEEGSAGSSLDTMDFKQKILPRECVHREEYILSRMEGMSSILHLGCSDAPFTKSAIETKTLLHFELLKKSREVIGFDLNANGLQLLQRADPDGRYVCGNAESLNEHFPASSMDLVIAGEIVEHLSNPGSFFEACAKVLRPDGILLITIPNSFGIRRYIHSLFGVENYHPDHTFYFSENTVATLASRYGFSIYRSRYYGSKPGTGWKKRALYFFIETLPARLFGNHFLEGLVIELKKRL